MNAIVKQLEKDSGLIKEWFEHMHRNPELSLQESMATEGCVANFSARAFRHKSLSISESVSCSRAVILIVR